MLSLGCPAPGGRQAVLSIFAFRAEGSAVSWDESIFASLQRCHRTVTENDLEFFSVRERRISLSSTSTGPPWPPATARWMHTSTPQRRGFLDSVKEVTKVLTLTAMDWSGKP